MNRCGFLLFFISIFGCKSAGAFPQDSISREVDIREINVTGRRLSEIGATLTVLDTFALRNNITYSLADVLSQNTSVFIKSYGRGTMSTASFRGTSPSHTQVTWNGMKLNSPILGMVDFSLIPSYFIDEASVLHGAASVNAAGGGLGGAIVLGTSPQNVEGFELNYIQGIGSFATYDQLMKFVYGDGKLQTVTRLGYVNSRNDFKFTNFDKRPAEDGRYVQDRNKNGSYRDFHAMQEVYFTPDDRNRFSGAVWFTDSRRGIPALTTDYREQDVSDNIQTEQSVKFVSSWKRTGDKLAMQAAAGYLYSDLVYKNLNGNDGMSQRETTHARSSVHTGYANYAVQWYPFRNLSISGDATYNVHYVDSQEKFTREHYQKWRGETSLRAAVKYKPAERIGLGAELREETYGSKIAVPIFAAFADYLLVPEYNLVLKASAARNCRHPTLNDLYYRPGGNDSLRPEKGYTYEGGLEFKIRRGPVDLKASATAYDSYINDWILWLQKGSSQMVFTPVNVKKVHSYGVELDGSAGVKLGRDWNLRIDALWGWTRSINHSEPAGEEDESTGKQLVYVPEFSTAVTGLLSWKTWSLGYNYNYYSKRFTTTSNDPGKVGRLGSYYMSDVSLGKDLSFRFAVLSLKATVHNLFNENYVTVLSRPMPRRNYGFFIGIRPRLSKRPLMP